MAYSIDAGSCTACGACEFECPNGAIGAKGDVFVINAKKCTECDGDPTPKCVSVCPADCCAPA